MIRVLFVDDEPGILLGLQNLLRKQRRRWDMVFAEGGEAGLAAFNENHFDVVVSDMRMPVIDGAELLRQVKAKSPEVIRLVLSGHADRDAILRTVAVAHQYLSKPCDPEVLPNIIDRALALKSVLFSETVAKAVGSVERLPTPPKLYWQLTAAMSDPQVGITAIAAMIEQDPSASAKLLQLVNAGFFGSSGRMSRVNQAVAFLGLEMVRALVLSAHLLQLAETKIPGFSHEQFQQEAIETARMAKRLAPNEKIGQEAFTAGLLHDIGKVVLLSYFGSVDLSREQELFGCTHAEVGAYLLALWGLPNPIVEAVAFHHHPSRVEQRGLEAVGCVHIAAALADTNGVLDPMYVGQLDHWRAIAKGSAG